MMPSSVHPFVAQAAQKLGTPLAHAGRSIYTSTTTATHSTSPRFFPVVSSLHAARMAENVARWRKNFARLYARRVLEMALLSAAAYRISTSQSEGGFFSKRTTTIRKPSRWVGWEAPDWEETALESLGDYKITRLFRSTVRLCQLAILGAPMAVLVPCGYVSETAHKASWRYALWGIEQAGPTWIKLVQWASTRPDIFSVEFCEYFGKLRDKTAGHSWAETKRILSEELGEDALEALELEEKTIGSGCIAQVYKGRLKQATGTFPKNTQVAIKVQHPRIWHKVCVDFYLLNKVAVFLEKIPTLGLEFLSLSDTVRQFRDIMLPQLDLTLEAAHLRRFNQDFSNEPLVSFPNPIGELTTTQVLTETYVEGKPIVEYVKAPINQRKALAQLGLQTTLKMIFLNDFVHGDLHPGNIIISGEHPKLVMNLLDCGLVLEMGPEQHVDLVKVLGAFTRKNGRLAGELMVDPKSTAQASQLDIELFVEGIERIVDQDEDENFIEKVGEYIAEICSLACKRRVKLEPAFINAALAVEIMEGIACALYPNLTVQEVALPLIVKAEVMHRMKLR